MCGELLGGEVVDGAADGLGLVRHEVEGVLLGSLRLRLELLGEVLVQLPRASGLARGGQACEDDELSKTKGISSVPLVFLEGEVHIRAFCHIMPGSRVQQIKSLPPTKVGV